MQRHHESNPPPRTVDHRPTYGALALIALVFGVDLLVPLGVAAAVPYTFAVLLALQSPLRWFALAAAALCGALTLVKMEVMPDRGTTEMWKVIANRCLALFAIGMTTLLGIRRRQSETRRSQAEVTVREQLADLARLGRLNTAGQLAAGLAHELNQPLSAVCLQAELAERLAAEGADSRSLVPALAEIAEQSHRAAEIVRGLRRMLRHDGPATADVNLNEVAGSVVRLLDSHAHRAKVELRMEHGSIPLVEADRVQLEQVVFNLVQNAVEAAAETSGLRRVTIATALEGGYVRVAVEDSGRGIPPGDEDRIFERFYSTKPDGMGMGLAISRSIVEAHGGRIRAERLPEGGSRLAFSVPAVQRTDT